MIGPAATTKVEFIGPRLPDYAHLAAAAVGKWVYGLPGSATRTIRIDGDTGTVTRVGPEVTNPFGSVNYAAAVVVDNHVYGIPLSAQRVLRINGDTGETDLIGPAMEGRDKYQCACALGHRIYAIPEDAQRVMRIDCRTGDVRLVGPSLGPQRGKYFTAAVVEDCIYAPPSNANQVLRVRLHGNTEHVELIGPDLGGAAGKYFCAAALGQDVYTLPCCTRRILRVSHGTGECSFVGPDFEGTPAYRSAAVMGSRIFGIGQKGKTKNMLCIEGRTGSIDFIGPNFEQGGEYYASAVVGKCVYALPLRGSSNVLSIDGDSGRVDKVGLGPGERSFGGAAVLRGRIYAFPFQPGQILQLTPPDFQRAINRWGFEIANVLTGTHHVLPKGFMPEHVAAECLDHVAFGGQPEVVRLAREAAAMMPAEERGAFIVIYAFTLESNLFPQVTAAIRADNAEGLVRWSEYIYHLEKALLRQPSFRGTVFRGVETLVPRQVYEPGTKVTWQSLSSATRRAWVIVRQKFVKVINGDELIGTIFVIQAYAARRVEHISFYPDEEEVIFGTNSHFLVHAMVTEDRMKRVLLPELEAYDLRRLRVFRMEEL